MFTVNSNSTAGENMSKPKNGGISYSSGTLVPAFRRLHCSREETRARIVEKAGELFHKFGFDRTPLSDIAANLGMSTANVYKFFPSKRVLIEACANVHLDQLRGILLQASHSQPNAIARIETVVLSLYHFNRKQIKNDYEFYRLMLQAHREEWVCIRDFRGLQVKILTDVLEEGVRSGELALKDTLQTAKVILDSMAWIINPVLFYELKEEDVEARLHTQVQFLGKALLFLKQ